MIQLSRKRVSKELKYNILSDHFQKGAPISELARLHGIHPITIYQWRRTMGDKAEEKPDIQKTIEGNINWPRILQFSLNSFKRFKTLIFYMIYFLLAIKASIELSLSHKNLFLF